MVALTESNYLSVRRSSQLTCSCTYPTQYVSSYTRRARRAREAAAFSLSINSLLGRSEIYYTLPTTPIVVYTSERRILSNITVNYPYKLRHPRSLSIG